MLLSSKGLLTLAVDTDSKPIFAGARFLFLTTVYLIINMNENLVYQFVQIHFRSDLNF